MVQVKILQMKPREIQQVRCAILRFVPRLMPVTSTRNEDSRLQTLPMDILSPEILIWVKVLDIQVSIPIRFTHFVPVCS